LLSVRNLTKTYRTGDKALSAVDLVVPKGQVMALIGPSGAGKSTLLYLLGLLDRPSAGVIQFGGQDVTRLSAERRAALRHAEIGFVFQFYHLIPELTALQNVKLGLMMLKSPLGYLRERRAIHQRAVDLLGSVGLGDRMKHYPRQLSGGQEQRVAIARAIVTDPTFLLCDEPTGDLDRKAAEEILDLLTELESEHGKTILMVTHDEDLARRANRQLTIADGEIVGDTGPRVQA